MRRNYYRFHEATFSVVLLIGLTLHPVPETSGSKSFQLAERLNASTNKVGTILSKDFEPPTDEGEPGPTAGGGTRNEQKCPQVQKHSLKHLLKTNNQTSAQYDLQT